MDLNQIVQLCWITSTMQI